MKENEKWGLIDTTGRPIIPSNYDAVSKLKDNYAIVGKYYDDGNWKFGIIKSNGEMFIDFIYETPRFFFEGLLAHKLTFEDEKWKDWLYKNYGETGLSLYKPKEVWGFIDAKAKIKINYQYGDFDEPQSYGGGLITFGKENINGYLDNVTEIGRFNGFPVGDFINGKALVLKKKWGIINKQGNVVVNFRYDEFLKFKDGYAAVKINNRWGFIDSVGNVIIKPEFEEVKEFNEGIVAVKMKRKWGYMNKHGVVLTPFKFDQAFEFNNGFGKVIFGFDSLFINIKGEELIKRP